MKVTLSLTHRCNLACRYCYSGRAFKQDMSFATARKIVDFAVEVAPAGQRIEFGFFGGEPLLKFDLIKEATNYIRQKEQETKRPVSLNITTNGTLVTESVLDFLNGENVSLCISIDGPAHIHDLNRCYRDGRGSSEEVVRALRLAVERLKLLQVNAVYSPDTIDSLLESVSFFSQLGVSVIHLNPNISASWDKDACSKLRAIYMQIGDYYIQSYQRGHEIAVNLIDNKVILFLKGGYSPGDRCGMGETEWGFAPSGNIYPCERFIGQDDELALCLGNIHTGIDVTRQCSVLKQRGNRNKECTTCALSKYCMNWCGCTNHYMTGHTDLAGPMLCASERAAMRAARHVLLTLQNDELFLDHFMKYLSRGATTDEKEKGHERKNDHIQNRDRVPRLDRGIR